MAKETIQKNINIKNRKASFEFSFLDKYIAGIVLTGTEIKSIRMGRVNMQESFCYFKDNELWTKQLHITPYDKAKHFNHESDRERKLLLKKKELKKLQTKMEEQALTIVPIRLFVNDKGLAKLEIALAKGKKLYDKREDIKTKDSKREMDRMSY